VMAYRGLGDVRDELLRWLAGQAGQAAGASPTSPAAPTQAAAAP